MAIWWDFFFLKSCFLFVLGLCCRPWLDYIRLGDGEEGLGEYVYNSDCFWEARTLFSASRKKARRRHSLVTSAHVYLRRSFAVCWGTDVSTGMVGTGWQVFSLRWAEIGLHRGVWMLCVAGWVAQVKNWDAVSGTLRRPHRMLIHTPGLALPGRADYPGIYLPRRGTQLPSLFPPGLLCCFIWGAGSFVFCFFLSFSSNFCFPINCSFPWL